MTQALTPEAPTDIVDIYVIGIGAIPQWIGEKISNQEFSIDVGACGEWLVQLPNRALVIPRGGKVALYRNGTIYFDAVEVRRDG